MRGDLDAHQRPGLLEANILETGGASGLLVATLDRLSGALHVLERLWSYGAVVYAADGGRGVGDDPLRTALRQMRGVFAQLVRAMLVKRMRDGRRAKRAAGGKPSGSYPFGHSKTGPCTENKSLLPYSASCATSHCPGTPSPPN